MTNRTRKKTKASDIMQQDLVVAYEDSSLKEALSLMTENHVTGLPVVNTRSQCVGIITATDILTYEHEHAELTDEANENTAQFFDPDTQQWESIRVGSFALEEFGAIPVSEIMARDLISVKPGTSLKEVAAKMVQEQVHRILVLSGEQVLHGLVAASDFVELFSESE